MIEVKRNVSTSYSIKRDGDTLEFYVNKLNEVTITRQGHDGPREYFLLGEPLDSSIAILEAILHHLKDEQEGHNESV